MRSSPSSERIHIGFFGCRNAGKSSLVNAIAGQTVSVVSETRGTTTDPVLKSMEILPLGPVVLMDTPGWDDEGALGAQRVERARATLRRTDLAVLVIDAETGFTDADRELITLFREKHIPALTVINKTDAFPVPPDAPEDAVPVSARTGMGIQKLKERLAALMPDGSREKRILSGLVSPGDRVVLVCPVDEAAPKGRLILPQQQVLRELLEVSAPALVVRETNLEASLRALRDAPDLVITDSQAFAEVAAAVPEEIPLTSFSILMARYKGVLLPALEGVKTIDRLQDGARVLMAEGCTHHRQCGDIGTVKIPAWLKAHTGKNLTFDTCSGPDFPAHPERYDLIIHCGGCMITEKDVQTRMEAAQAAGVPFANYGLVIARMKGILDRSTRMLPEVTRDV